MKINLKERILVPLVKAAWATVAALCLALLMIQQSVVIILLLFLAVLVVLTTD